MQTAIKTTLKGFKWIQPFLVYFLLASSCFSSENNNSLLAQSKVEYWLEEFGRCEKEKKPFIVEIKSGSNDGKLTEGQLRESILALAKAIKSNPSSLTSIKIVAAAPKLEEESDYSIPYKQREAKNISKQKDFDKFFFENLFEAISNNNKIEWVHFFSEDIFNRKNSHEISSKSFFKMIKEAKTIKSVFFTHCYFSEDEVLELAELLSKNKTVVGFDLRGLKNLTIKGEKALLKALTSNRSIECVFLFPISPKNNDEYFTLINKNKSLRTYLSEFEFNKEEELKFSQAISSNPNSTISFNLDSRIPWENYNNFTLEGKKAFLKALIHNNIVKSLRFSSVTHELNESLCDLIKKNKVIEKIYIENCDFYEEEVLELAKAISDNKTIKEIDLKGLGRQLTLKGKKALREAEEKRTKTSWFSLGKKEPLIILLPNIPDDHLNQNRGR